MALSRPWAQFKAGSVTWWISREFDHADLRVLARTLAKLHDAGFSHSDPNLSNWLVVGSVFPQPNLVAIDLDGVRQAGFVSAIAAARDLYRLVRYMLPYERAWFAAHYCRARKRPLDARAFLRLCQAHI